MQSAVNPLPGLPHVESPLFDKWIDSTELTDSERQVARDLHEKGFAVIDFPDPDIDAMAERIKSDLSELPQFSSVKNIEKGEPAEPGARAQDRVEHADIRSIASNEHIIALLEKLYGRAAFPFQTLNFAMGTQQNYHSDSVHFSSVPERFVVGVWVALEDIGPDQGPLVYYPGSHKWPILQSDDVGHTLGKRATKRGQEIFEDGWAAMVEGYGARPEYFHAKKGQALIWAANLLHGGSAHRDPLKTRWSQVTHYYFENCTYTTPMHSNPRLGKVFIRRKVRDIRTGDVVPNMYLGRPLDDEPNSSSFGKAAQIIMSNRLLFKWVTRIRERMH